MTMRNWGFATGIAAALALFGNAQAQSPGTGNQPAGTGQAEGTTRDTTGTEQPGERSGWSGTEANRAGDATRSTPGGQSDATGGTAGSTGSAETGSTGSTAGSAMGQKLDKDLQEKLQKIHAANQAELQMADLGSQRAESPEVKQYAEMLRKDHQEMDQQLTQAAQASGAQLEGKAFEKKQKDAHKDMEKLQSKSGAEFDREFMSHMVKDHEKDLKDVKSAAKDAKKGNHTELASVLDQASRGIEGHRDQAERIHDTLKSQKGQAATGTSAPGSVGSTGAGAESGTGTAVQAGPRDDTAGSRGTPDAGSTGAGSTAPEGTPAPVGSGKDPGDTGQSGGRTQQENPSPGR
jgi:putative membrane protein